MTGTPHVNDIGTSIRLTIRNSVTNAIVDLSTMSSAIFTFERPDNTSFEVTDVQLYTDGTDGVLEYLTVADDLNQAGRWRVQPTYTMPSGTWSGTPETMTVKPLIASD